MPRLRCFHRSQSSIEIGVFVKRICLAGAVVAAVLILVVSSALAAKKATGTKFTCHAAVTLQVPGGDNAVTPDAQSGSLAGPASCAKLLGKGVTVLQYTMADSGNLVGKWQQWFNTGTLYGSFSLTPSDNQPTAVDSFSAASYSGRFVIKNGHGAGARATGKGTIKCSTKDSVHFTCSESGRVSLG
jgi:hypothetical protein